MSKAYISLPKFLPIINEGCFIISTTFVNAVLGMPDASVYAASKAALLSINKVLARELAPRQTRVNAVSRDPIATPI